MGAVATTAPPVSMNIATTRSIANTAARQAMALAATIPPRRSTATALAATSASGAAPHPMVPAASTARLESMRSEAMRRRKRAEEHKLTLNSSVDYSRVKSSNALQMFQNSYKSPRLCASAGNIKPRAHSTVVFRLNRRNKKFRFLPRDFSVPREYCK